MGFLHLRNCHGIIPMAIKHVIKLSFSYKLYHFLTYIFKWKHDKRMHSSYKMINVKTNKNLRTLKISFIETNLTEALQTLVYIIHAIMFIWGILFIFYKNANSDSFPPVPAINPVCWVLWGIVVILWLWASFLWRKWLERFCYFFSFISQVLANI